MESSWLRDRRQHFLDVALSAPELSDEQRQTIRRLDSRWAMLGFTLQSRINNASRGRALAHFIQKPFQDAVKGDIEGYLTDMARRATPSTLLTTKRFLKVYYRELLAPGQKPFPAIVDWISLRSPVGIATLPKVILSQDEVFAAAKSCTHPRDRAIVMAAYDGAPRPGELVSAKVGDVEFDAFGARLTLAGKTGNRKVRLIHSAEDLKAWLNLHPRPTDPEAPLFVSLAKGYGCEPLFQDGIARTIAAAAKRAGVLKRVTPYTLRRSRLTHLARVLSEVELKIFGGWSLDSKMVKVYVHLSGQDVDDKLLLAAGIVQKDADDRNKLCPPRKCGHCQAQNSPASQFCAGCRRPLDNEAWIAKARETEKLLPLIPKLVEILSQDPRFKELLAAEPTA